ncbi:PREDICTED: uncharacterized protein LOC109580345 [Amphimedon queenslandica]|nr:PREDICTED: uncharacterized protein LOC109580345 [Amphimedon queenslandica]|eukprot:XP_019848934.1 PREDICTED: uncharacterized protein LOC109580345 [Amphimedon queenslandica]
MALKQLKEEQSQFCLNNESNKDSDDEEDLMSPKDSKIIQFINNDLWGKTKRRGPQSDSPTKACEALGCRNKFEEKLYFAVRFACREREDHPIICETCFYKSDCPNHREGLSVDHNDYKADNDTQAWP